MKFAIGFRGCIYHKKSSVFVAATLLILVDVRVIILIELLACSLSFSAFMIVLSFAALPKLTSSSTLHTTGLHFQRNCIGFID
jgi:hypothetical protein